jgi:hypothetical protein
VLLVDNRKRQVVEGNVVRKSACANEQMNVAAREPLENVAALAAALAPVRIAASMPAEAASGAIVARC